MKKKKVRELEYHLDFSIRQTEHFLDHLTLIRIETENQQRAAEIRIAIGILETRLLQLKAITTVDEMKVYFDTKKAIHFTRNVQDRANHEL